MSVIRRYCVLCRKETLHRHDACIHCKTVDAYTKPHETLREHRTFIVSKRVH